MKIVHIDLATKQKLCRFIATETVSQELFYLAGGKMVRFTGFASEGSLLDSNRVVLRDVAVMLVMEGYQAHGSTPKALGPILERLNSLGITMDVSDFLDLSRYNRAWSHFMWGCTFEDIEAKSGLLRLL